jgi:hypothetical protein
MTGMEKGIFQADEYQLPANWRRMVTLNRRLQYELLLPFG